jgi:hypothetical protein
MCVGQEAQGHQPNKGGEHLVELSQRILPGSNT